MMVEPIVACVEAVRPMADETGRFQLMFTPQGRRLDQAGVECRLGPRAADYALCGR